MRFEWDDEKKRRNLKKHKISFEVVPTMFHGHVVELVDHRHDDEVRFLGLGLIRGFVYPCIYTYSGDARRIISLRRANKNEQEIFFSNI